MGGSEIIDVVEFSGFRLERGARRLTGPDGVLIALKPKVFDLLAHLVANRGEVVDKRDLLDAVWPGVVVEENNLNQAVSALRRVLGDSRDEPRFIATVQGRGYQFVAPVRPASRAEPIPPHAASASPAAAQAIALLERLGLGRDRLRLAGGVLAVLVVATAIAVILPRTQAPSIEAAAVVTSSAESSAASPLAAREPTVAVLPFLDMSEGGDQEYLADGLSEELMDQLVRIDGLRVTGRTSSFAFKGRNEDVRTIGETLGVAHVLEGSVRRSGDDVRITAQLIDATTGYHLWSQSYDRALGDIFAVQRDIALRVADALSLQIGAGHDFLRATVDPEAYELVLRAEALQRIGSSPESILNVEALSRAALARDPDYVAALRLLSNALSAVVVYFPERAADARLELVSVLQRAETLSPGDGAQIEFSLAMDRGDFIAARKALDEARATLPPSSIAGMKAMLDVLTGRPSAAVEQFRELARTDPLNLSGSAWLQAALGSLGRVEEAEAEYRRSQTVIDAYFQGFYRAPLESYAIFRAVKGGFGREEISARYARFLSGQPTSVQQSVTQAGAFDILAVLDDREAALAGLRRELERPTTQTPRSVAWWADYFEDADLTIEALRQSLDTQGARSGIFIAALENVRKDPRFKDIVRDYGYYEYWRTTGEWSDFCRPVGEDDFECW